MIARRLARRSVSHGLVGGLHRCPKFPSHVSTAFCTGLQRRPKSLDRLPRRPPLNASQPPDRLDGDGIAAHRKSSNRGGHLPLSLRLPEGVQAGSVVGTMVKLIDPQPGHRLICVEDHGHTVAGRFPVHRSLPLDRGEPRAMQHLDHFVLARACSISDIGDRRNPPSQTANLVPANGTVTNVISGDDHGPS